MTEQADQQQASMIGAQGAGLANASKPGGKKGKKKGGPPVPANAQAAVAMKQ